MMKNKGFTLVEMIVAVGLFAIVMMVATGAIFSIVNANRSAQALNSTITNFSFAAESMVRDIRTGHGYVCGGTLPISSNPTDCTSTGAPSIAFYDADNNPVQYYWGVNPCDSANTQQQIYKWENNAVCPIAITAPEVTIQSMTFYVSGTSIVAHDHQPKVLLTIKGFAGTGKNQSSFNIQTFISQRLLNTP